LRVQLGYTSNTYLTIMAGAQAHTDDNDDDDDDDPYVRIHVGQLFLM